MAGQVMMLVTLNERWRVVDDPLQFILQYRDREIRHSGEKEIRRAWQGKQYCRTRAALIRCIHEYCGQVDPAALAYIETWPERHAPGVVRPWQPVAQAA